MIKALSILFVLLSMFMGSLPSFAKPFAYISSQATDSVTVVDLVTNAVVDTIVSEALGFAVTVSPDGSSFYVAGGLFSCGNCISVVDTATNTFVDAIPLGGFPSGLVVSPDGSTLYSGANTGPDTGAVSLIDTGTNSVVDVIGLPPSPLGGPINPRGMVLTPDGSKLYVAGFSTALVYVIDTSTKAVTKTISVGSAPAGIDITADGSRLYVANFSSLSVSIIDTATDSVTNTILNAGNRPFALAITPDGSTVYVTNSSIDHTVSVIDTATNLIIHTISVGNNPEGISITPDGKKVYVTNRSGNSVSIIDTDSNTVIDTIAGIEGANPFGKFISLGSSGHNLNITNGPLGVPNPVASGEGVELIVDAVDTSGDKLNYLWDADCSSWSASNGDFNDNMIRLPVWTAPVNETAGPQDCLVTVTVDDGPGGLSTQASFTETVDTLNHTLTITSGPSGSPNPVGSLGNVSLSLAAIDSLNHKINYLWESNCPSSSFDDNTLPSPVWIAPENTTGIPHICQITVTVDDGAGGLSEQASFIQTYGGPGVLEVLPDPTSGFSFSGPIGGPFLPASEEYDLTNTGGEQIFALVSREGGFDKDWISLQSPLCLGGGTCIVLLNPGQTRTIPVVPGNAANDLCAGLRTQTITFTNSTSGIGDTSRIVSMNISGVENIKPVVTVVAGREEVVAEATGEFTLVNIEGDATALDDTDGPIIPLPDTFGPFPLGETIVTWQVTDCSGNTGTAEQKVTVVDTTPPAVTAPPSRTLEAKMTSYSKGELDPFGSAGATDNVEVVVGPLPLLTGNLGVGTHLVKWFAVDSAGLVGEAFQAVTVIDTTPPDLVIPPDIIHGAVSVPVKILDIGMATATDNADPNPIITVDAPFGNFFDVGETFVQWTAKDASFNTRVKLQKITVTLADAKLRAIEVIQASQDLNNSVDLVAGKTTRVRAYFVPVLDPAPSPLPSVSPRLSAYRNNSQLPPGPISPTNFMGSVVAQNNIINKRNTTRDSNSLRTTAANFMIPEDWTNGQVTFKLTSSGFKSFNCNDALPNVTNDCKTTVTFKDEAVLEAVILGIYFEFDDRTVGPTVQNLVDEEIRLRAAFPIANPLIPAHRSLIISDWDFLGIEPGPMLINSTIDDARTIDGCGLFCDTQYFGVVHNGYGTEEKTGGQANGFDSAMGTTTSGLSSSGTRYGTFRIAHEMAHNLDQQHTEEGFEETVCGEEGFSDPFPYVFRMDQDNNPSTPKVRRATLGPVAGSSNALGSNVIIGWDSSGQSWGNTTSGSRMISPEITWELMSYCGSDKSDKDPDYADPFPNFRWPSGFTYERIYDELVSDFGTTSAQVSASESSSKRLQGDTVDSSNYYGSSNLMIQGIIDHETGDLRLGPIWKLDDMAVSNNMPPGDYTLQLLDENSNMLDEISFQPFDGSDGVGGDDGGVDSFFKIPVVFDERIHEIRIVRAGQLLGSSLASSNAPAVEVLFPNGGEVLQGENVTLRWRGKDKDNKALLRYTVLFSADQGNNWQTLAMNYRRTSLLVNLNELAESESALIKVMVSDGFMNDSDVSDSVFSTPNSTPFVHILAPLSFQIFGGEQMIVAKAYSKDVEDMTLLDENLFWESNIDGFIGEGHNVTLRASALTPGDHRITLTARDSDGAEASDTVTIKVFGEEAPPIVISHVATNPEVIWPPNHQMIPVTVDVNVRKLATLEEPVCEIVSITSNEGDNELGDGNTTGDAIITGPLTAEVRAERSGKGAGRQYNINVECVSTDGETVHTATDVGIVRVPHNEPKN